MDILSIGNSFSQDAQRYLHGVAKCAGERINCFNLYIGGCPLSRHYRNMLSGERAYALEMNGISTGFFVSLKEALLSRDWPLITVQQVSSKSPDYKSYQPYLQALVDFIRECVPKAKLAIHQTWGYEDGSRRLTEEMGYASYKDMFKDIKASYELAAKDSVADYIIPSGEVMARLIESDVKIHRDTFHLSLGIGRYAAALTWVRTLTGADVLENGFSDFDVPIPDEEAELARRFANEIGGEYRERVILPF